MRLETLLALLALVFLVSLITNGLTRGFLRWLGPRYLSRRQRRLLRAVADLHPNAYGVPLREELERVTGRAVSYGALYAAADSLVERGLIFYGKRDPTAARGWRPKCFMMLTEEGERALREGWADGD